jgi:hypothetical protein
MFKRLYLKNSQFHEFNINAKTTSGETHRK